MQPTLTIRMLLMNRRRLMTAAAIALALASVGCTQNRQRGPRPVTANDLPMEDVLANINRNSEAMDFLLRAGGVNATGKYFENGKSESFEFRGTLLYRKPRLLYLQLQHALGGKMEVGSNDDEFWVWKRLGEDHYWWGEYKNVDAGADVDIPIRPDHLLQVLGLQELPDSAGEDGPLFWVGPDRYEFVFMDHDEDGRGFIARTIDVSRQPPTLIREMVYFNRDGHPKMVAHLSEYGIVEGSKVQAPHRIQIHWIEDGSWIDMKFGSMRRFDESAAAKRFISPRQQGRSLGKVERVDEPAPPPRRPAATPREPAAPRHGEDAPAQKSEEP
jgi:hypothetical protein